MANVAVIGDDLAFFAHMVTVVAAEATLRDHVSCVVGMRLPIDTHFWKHVVLEDPLKLRDRFFNVAISLSMEVLIIRVVKT